MHTSRPFPLPVAVLLLLLLLVSLLVSVPAFPATYVVDPAGNDASAGDTSAPWRTIQYAASQAAAGDTVIIHAGTYPESVYLAHGGAAGAPIDFAADPGVVLTSPNPAASMEAIDVGPAVGYVTLEGFEATGGFDETLFLRSGAHDVDVRGCTLHGNHAGIIMSDVYNVTVEQCSVHDNSGEGVRVAGSSHAVEIRDTASVNNGDPTTCSPVVDGFAVEDTASNITLLRDQALQNGGDGFDLKGDQVLADGIESTGNACTGVKVWQDGTLRDCLITGNARGVGITSIPGATAVDVSNCTIANNNGVGMDLNDPMTPGTRYAVTLINDLVAGDYKALQYGTLVGLTERSNIFFRATSPYDDVLSPFTGRRFTGHDVNTGLWARRSHQGAGTLAVDPLFVDPANGDFHVAPTSAAVGRGAVLDAGSGTPPNIGVYQTPGGPTNHSPWADPGRNRSGRSGRKLRFNARGSLDPDGTPLVYVWDFGDGSAPVAGFRAAHAYAAPGIYSVTLAVSDGSLSSSAGVHAAIH